MPTQTGEMTAETILTMIEQLPPAEQSRLRQLLNQRQPSQRQSESSPEKMKESPTGKLVHDLRPMPDSSREMRWLALHQRDYIGQWVALDGDRLIAASPNHDKVAAAAEADGAELPLFAFIDDPDKIYAGF